MGAALDLVSSSATAPGGAGAAAVAVAGDSLNVKNCPIGMVPLLLSMWAKTQAVGFVQVTHPSGHDVTRDIRARLIAANPLPVLPIGWSEELEPQETMAVTIAGSAVAGQVELVHQVIYYPELPGVSGRFIDPATLDARIVDLVTVEDTTTAAAAATYGGSRAINAASDLLLANTDYALLGAHVGVVCGALAVQAPDFGNLRMAIPGIPGRPEYTSRWFEFLSAEFGLPLIPVFNSANKGNILITNVQDQALTAVPFSLMLARLSM